MTLSMLAHTKEPSRKPCGDGSLPAYQWYVRPGRSPASRDLRGNGVQVVGGSNPLTPTNFPRRSLVVLDCLYQNSSCVLPRFSVVHLNGPSDFKVPGLVAAGQIDCLQRDGKLTLPGGAAL